MLYHLYIATEIPPRYLHYNFHIMKLLQDNSILLDTFITSRNALSQLTMSLNKNHCQIICSYLTFNMTFCSIQIFRLSHKTQVLNYFFRAEVCQSLEINLSVTTALAANFRFRVGAEPASQSSVNVFT